MALQICRLAILIFVVILLVGRGFAGDASLPKAKQEAETKGYLFETRHDDIVAKAKKEGKLRVFTALDAQRTLRELSDRFKMKYPFVSEIQWEERRRNRRSPALPLGDSSGPGQGLGRCRDAQRFP